MTLSDLLARHGYRWRQHLPEEGWGGRKLTVVDLDADQQAALEVGGETALQSVLSGQDSWPFPSMDIRAPLPRSRGVLLSQDGRAVAAVVVGRGTGAAGLADQIVDAVAARTAVRLPILPDEPDAGLLERRPLLLIGGSHESRLALALALRHRTFFIDASVPGPGGWAVTTQRGLGSGAHDLLQISTEPGQHAEVLALLGKSLSVAGPQWRLEPVHRVEPGPDLRELLPSWPALVAPWPGMLPDREDHSLVAPQDPLALSHLIARGFDCGGREKNLYNAAPFDIAIQAARYYHFSADRRALEFFHHMMFRIADYYLRTPQGASYPADIDFRIGPLLLEYARLEHDPIFSDDDRLLLGNLLLSIFRAVHQYTLTVWPIDPARRVRFNHQTFKALSLSFGAWYFGRHGIPDAAAWSELAQAVFADWIWQRTKQSENANTYELLVYDHAAAYALFHGRPITSAMRHCLKTMVQRQMTATDNFLRPVDYGDARIALQPQCAGMARLLATCDDDPAVAWFAEADLPRGGDLIASFLHEHPGLRRPRPASPPPAGDWELAPLDPAFAADYAPGFDAARGFDKLAFRTGWTDDDHYLLWEGVGNLDVGHCHADVNSIVRLNHLGRHWVVSNGYGRRVGIHDVSKSFSTRVRGPEDHNMLVLRRDGQIVRALPACNTLHHRGRIAQRLTATAGIEGYGGASWTRRVLIDPGQYVLVIDRVRIDQPGLEAGHIEWNALGSCQPRADGYRLEQQGVYLHVSTLGDWAAQQQWADQSANWQDALGTQYPYATFPLVKLVYNLPNVKAGGTHTLVTLLETSRRPEPAYRLRRVEGHVGIAGPSQQVWQVPD